MLLETDIAKGVWRVALHEGLLSAGAARAAWEELHQADDAAVPMTHPSWVARHLVHFHPRGEARVLVAYRDDRARAVLPLVWGARGARDILSSKVRSPTSSHSGRFDVVGDPDAAEALWSALRDRVPHWSMLDLSDLPVLGTAFRLGELARKDGFLVAELAGLRSPYLPLPDSFEALEAGLDSKFRANLRRRRRKIEAEVGPLRLEPIEDGQALEEALSRGFALEAGGWKGKEGTAIACSEKLSSFYTDVARWAASDGLWAGSLLYAGARTVSFHYSLELRDRLYLLKPGYDESLSGLGVGHLHVAEVLRRACAEGVKEFDFLGADMEWKRCWTSLIREHRRLLIARPNILGRAHFEAAVGLRRRAKKLLVRIGWRKSP